MNASLASHTEYKNILIPFVSCFHRSDAYYEAWNKSRFTCKQCNVYVHIFLGIPFPKMGSTTRAFRYYSNLNTVVIVKVILSSQKIYTSKWIESNGMPAVRVRKHVASQCSSRQKLYVLVSTRTQHTRPILFWDLSVQILIQILPKKYTS